MTDKEAAKALLEEVANARGGKTIWLTKDGAYEVDDNFNPPRIKKLERKDG